MYVKIVLFDDEDGVWGCYWLEINVGERERENVIFDDLIVLS